MAADLSTLDATDQAELVRRGDITPRELVTRAIERIERVNPKLNAVITPLFEKALAAAASPRLPAGPFRGVPYLLKDLASTSADDPFYAGMRFLRDLRWVEREDSGLVAKLRAAGFVIVGRTNVPELGPVPTTEPVAFGPTRNPWNPAHSSGGSSGGSAAAVASGMVPAAHASDGGGSIRIPASECGLVGLKPSRGRVSLGPQAADAWHGLAIEHAVTHTVRDSAALLDVVSGPLPGDPYTAPPPARPFRDEVGAPPGRLRVGVLATLPSGQPIHPECAAAARDAGRLLESLGHSVSESHPTALDDHEALRHTILVVAAWTANDLDYWSARTGRPIGADDVEPMIWAIAEMGRPLSAPDYIKSATYMQLWARRIATWWSDFDLLVTPTIPDPPPPLGEFDPAPDNPLQGFGRGGHFVTFTMPYNVTGQPAVSLPLAWSVDGLPLGVQLVAAYGREDLLFRIAAQLEEARPWRGRRPPIHA
jgi:amidase